MDSVVIAPPALLLSRPSILSFTPQPRSTPSFCSTPSPSIDSLGVVATWSGRSGGTPAGGSLERARGGNNVDGESIESEGLEEVLLTRTREREREIKSKDHKQGTNLGVGVDVDGRTLGVEGRHLGDC